jgi:hypothetical protein
MIQEHEMPALVAHILHDLEANYGFGNLMYGSDCADKQIRLLSDWDGQERLFEVSPHDEGLTLVSPSLNTSDRYCHVLTLARFGQPDAYTGDHVLYVQVTASVGLRPFDISSVSVVFEVSDGDGERARAWEAPFLYSELDWTNWAESEWPRVKTYADELVREYVEEAHMATLIDSNAALAA